MSDNKDRLAELRASLEYWQKYDGETMSLIDEHLRRMDVVDRPPQAEQIRHDDLVEKRDAFENATGSDISPEAKQAILDKIDEALGD